MKKPKKKEKLKGHKFTCVCSLCKWIATRNQAIDEYTAYLSSLMEPLEEVYDKFKFGDVPNRYLTSPELAIKQTIERYRGDHG